MFGEKKEFKNVIEVRLAVGQADNDLAPEARLRLAIGADERIVDGPILDASEALSLLPTVATFVGALAPLVDLSRLPALPPIAMPAKQR